MKPTYILISTTIDEFRETHEALVCISNCKLKLTSHIEEMKSAVINKNERIEELDDFFEDNIEDTIEELKESELSYTDVVLAHNAKLQKLYNGNELEYIEWIDIRDEYVVHESYYIQEVMSLDG